MLKDRLKQLREEFGFTQENVAKKLNISRVAYTQYELGKREPDFKTLKELANMFEVSTDFLLENDSSKILLTNNDLKELQKEADKIREYINASLITSFEGMPKNEDTYEKVMKTLEYGMQLAKQEAKEKFTPVLKMKDKF